MSSLGESLALQLVGGLLLLVVGAVLSTVFRASGVNANYTNLTSRTEDVAGRLSYIERILSEGGPIALAARVDRLEKSLSDMSSKIDQMYMAIVLGKKKET